jgi:anti-sigma B factor antagonist
MLEIRLEHVHRGEVVVRVGGEMDCETSGQFRAAITALLNRGGVESIGVDLRAVEFLDSTAIGTLVVAQRICRQVGVRLRLIAVSAFASRVLGVVGVDERLGLSPRGDLVAALADG